MQVIEASEVHAALNFKDLVEALRRAFGGPAGAPPRSVYKLEEDGSSNDAFAVLPAWSSEVIGVKAFTYLPSNVPKGLDILNSKILLFKREDGTPLALVDGTSVTYWRTAAVAALGADYLARKDASRLLVCGTGNLSPYMAQAHATVRPITDGAIWGRNPDKAAKVVEELNSKRPDVNWRVAGDLESEAREADVISCATASHDPIIFGDWIGAGQYADFIGNHEKDGRECDTELVVKSRFYVDSRANVLNECGEILIPIEEGRVTEDHIVGELADLCSGRVKGRQSDDEITVYKSVGSALSDLAAAQLVTQKV